MAAQKLASAEPVTPASICGSCNKPLGMSEVALLSYPDYRKVMHSSCFRCFNCNRPLSSGYVVRTSQAYCRACASTMYQTICFDCGVTVKYGEETDDLAPISAMGNVYHRKCFICSACNEKIIGKFYVSKLSRPFCKKHPPEGIPKELELQDNDPSQKKPPG